MFLVKARLRATPKLFFSSRCDAQASWFWATRLVGLGFYTDIGGFLSHGGTPIIHLQMGFSMISHPARGVPPQI